MAGFDPIGWVADKLDWKFDPGPEKKPAKTGSVKKDAPAPRPAADRGYSVVGPRPAPGPANRPVYAGARGQQWTPERAAAQGAAPYHPPVGVDQRVREREDQQLRDTNQLAADRFNKSLLGGAQETTVKEMDWASYQALSPRQKAAVDLNTELVAAVNMDKQTADAAASSDEYKTMVEQLFGADRGSDTVAPRTVAVLQELGLKSQMPTDLDQYLGLHALVSEDDLRFLTDDAVASTRARVGADFSDTGEKTAPGGKAVQTSLLNPGSDENPRDASLYDDPEATRAEYAMRFSDVAKARLANSLTAGQGLVQKIQNNTDFGAQLFGEPTASVGYGGSSVDGALQGIFDTMARRDVEFPEEELNVALGSLGLAPEQLSQFFETRLKAAEYGGKPIGDDPEGQYYDPAEFRARYYAGGN